MTSFSKFGSYDLDFVSVKTYYQSLPYFTFSVPTSTLVIGLSCYMPNLSHIVFIGMSQLNVPK